jgi:hypothetical protein
MMRPERGESCTSRIRVYYSSDDCMQRSLNGPANVLFVVDDEYCGKGAVTDIWPVGVYMV